MRIEAWRVHDTGLVAAPGPYRRLPGRVRHHQGQGAEWPDTVALALSDADELVVTSGATEVGRWPRAEASIRPVGAGPPVTFVIAVPGGSHLLAAPADATTAAFVAALSDQARQ